MGTRSGTEVTRYRTQIPSPRIDVRASAVDQLFPDRVGEIYNIAHSPSQRWYFAPQMTADEVLLIKGLDSLDDGRARFAPHGAFHLSETRENAPARESIEVRTLVIIQ